MQMHLIAEKATQIKSETMINVDASVKNIK